MPNEQWTLPTIADRRKKRMQVHSKTPKFEARTPSARVLRTVALSAMLILGGCELNDGNSTTPRVYALGSTSMAGGDGSIVITANP
jgi:hypothetical protein